EKALVSVDMNGVMSITIEQREAVVRVINLRGEDFYIDRNKVKLPLSDHFAPKVLVANGFIGESYNGDLDSVQTPLLAELYETASFISKSTLWNDQISQLFVNRNKEIEMVPLVGEHQIILGNADSLEVKFDKLLLFYKHVIPTVGWGVYKSVNLSFANQLVCTKEES